MNNFRLINKIEESIINDSVLKISSEIVAYFKKKDCRFYISISSEQAESKFPSIYLVSYDKSKFLEERLKNENLHSAGIYFGFIKKGIFHLSLEGVEFLRDHKILPNCINITVNAKGEKSVLYGNDVVKSFTINVPPELKRNDLLAILNHKNEIIALARAEIDYSSFDNLKLNQKIARNLVDKGHYLRKKQ